MTINPGDVYWVPLQQDWTTCKVVSVTETSIIVDFEGHLIDFGVPRHQEEVPLDHFLAAYEIAPEGHWSRIHG